MTTLPEKTERKLGLVIDLDTCVGCHACVVSCKGWNTENYGAPLADVDAYGKNPVGTFLNRVHSYEVTPEEGTPQLVHFPKSCLHCEDAHALQFVLLGQVIRDMKTVLYLLTKAIASGVVLSLIHI